MAAFRRIQALVIVAGLVFTPAAATSVNAQTASQSPDWRLVGQLELPPGTVVGPLSASLAGELVAGTVWDRAAHFTGRVWTMADGLRVSDLEGSFQALLPIEFTQGPFDMVALPTPVFAHSRQEVRRWIPADGAIDGVIDGVLAFGNNILANDVLFDPFRGTHIVSQQFGSLLVYAPTGEVLGAIEVDALRPHRGLSLSMDGTLLVVDAAGYTLSADMAGLPIYCGQADCAEAYQNVSATYGPYEALIAFDSVTRRVATLPEVDSARAGIQDGVFRAVAEPTLRIWNDIRGWTTTAEADLEITGFDGALAQAAFSSDGAWLLTLDGAGNLAVWAMPGGAAVLRLPASDTDRIVSAQFIPQGTSLYVHRSSGASQIVDLGKGAVVQDIPAPNASVIVSPDGRVMITYSEGEAPARLWHRR